MPDAKTYVYEVYKTHIDTDQMVLVQIFRDPETDKVLHAQIAFKNAAGDSWGIPYSLEKQ